MKLDLVEWGCYIYNSMAFAQVAATELRLTITSAVAEPMLSMFAVYSAEPCALPADAGMMA